MVGMMNAKQPMSKPSLINRVALVTRGAGGLGAAICGALAIEGATVIVGFNNSSKAACFGETFVIRLNQS